MAEKDYKPDEFNFDQPFEDTKWLVKNVIPLGHLGVLLAQSGSGKSFVLEWLGTNVAFGLPFLDFDTDAGNVLLIDQDTPTDVLKRRLVRMGKALGSKPKHKLDIFSMRDLSLSNGSLVYVVKNSDAKLVIIDCMHSVCGGLNPNKTFDMSKLALLKAECLTKDRTIIIAHHITEKVTRNLNEMMNSNSHISGMGNSAIRQQTDTEYILTSTINDGKIDQIYLRPVAKRAAVSQKPLILRILEPNEDIMSLEFAGYYVPDLDESEQDIYMLFTEFPKEYTIKEIVEAVGQKYSVQEVRDALVSLEIRKKLIMSRSRHNMFKYRMPKSE